jgi:DHA2 family multidrug resistance protein
MDAQFALLIRGAGMGCLFMTLNVTVFRTLQGRDIAQASSILNLSRQLGGSFGIAVLNTYVVHMQAQHRSVLVENISSSNGIALTRIHDYAGMFLSHGFSMQAAKDGAYTLINSAINIQSATMAYDNAFLLIGLCMLLAAPTILMLKPNLALASKNGKR